MLRVDLDAVVDVTAASGTATSSTVAVAREGPACDVDGEGCEDLRGEKSDQAK